MTRKLGEIATFKYGYTSPAKDKGEFRYIRITDIDEFGNISERKKKYINLANQKEQNRHLLKPGDILVARTGSVGETAIFSSKEKSVFASYLIRINFNQEIILPKYYWFFAKSEKYWNQVNNLTKGTAQPQFNANSLKEISTPLPNLKEQKRIIATWEDRKGKIITNQSENIRLFQEEEKEILDSLWQIN